MEEPETQQIYCECCEEVTEQLLVPVRLFKVAACNKCSHLATFGFGGFRYISPRDVKASCLPTKCGRIVDEWQFDWESITQAMVDRANTLSDFREKLIDWRWDNVDCP